jgi:hypothetical protein
MPDKTLFTPLQLDLSLNTFTPAPPPTPPRRSETMMRTSPFRIGSLLSRKNSTAVAPSSTPVADVGPRFQARDSTDGGPGTAGYEGVYKVSDTERSENHALTNIIAI